MKAPSAKENDNPTTRTNVLGRFRAKIAITALKSDKTLAERAEQFDHPGARFLEGGSARRWC
jgi:hypothetical protein